MSLNGVNNTVEKLQKMLQEAERIARLGCWNWDIKNNVLLWSDGIYRIFGLELQEFGATYEAFLSLIHPEDRTYVKQAVNEALYAGKSYDIEHRIVLPDGTVRIVHEQGEVTYGNGNPIRMFGTVHDITERRKIELDMELQTKKFNKLDKYLKEAIAERDRAEHLLDVLVKRIKITQDIVVDTSERLKEVQDNNGWSFKQKIAVYVTATTTVLEVIRVLLS